MAFVQSKQVVAGVPPLSADDCTSLVGVTAEYVTPTGGLASGTIIEMGAIPPGYVPIDLIVHTGILGASVTLDAGICSGEYGTLPAVERTLGSEFFASAQAAATAVLLRANKSFAAVTPADINAVTVGWGLKIGGATTAAGIKIRATLVCQPAPVAM